MQRIPNLLLVISLIVNFSVVFTQNIDTVVSPYVASADASDAFSWDLMVEELTEKSALWKANDISEYAFQRKTDCYCMDCYRMPKFVYIVDGVAKDVQYDALTLDQWGIDCNDSTLSTPIADYYHPIDWYYQKALSFAQKGRDANCSSNSSDSFGWHSMFCGGSVLFEYDDTLFYPTKLYLIYGPLVADGDMYYDFGCLTVMDEDTTADLSGYGGECTEYRPPRNSSDLCVCTMEYDPYCCGGRDFGNKCHAECEGFYVYTDCERSQCDGPPSRDSSECLCTKEYVPYCCDGEVYGNQCTAECQGFDVAAECEQSTECFDLDLPSKGEAMLFAPLVYVISFVFGLVAF